MNNIITKSLIILAGKTSQQISYIRMACAHTPKQMKLPAQNEGRMNLAFYVRNFTFRQG